MSCPDDAPVQSRTPPPLPLLLGFACPWELTASRGKTLPSPLRHSKSSGVQDRSSAIASSFRSEPGSVNSYALDRVALYNASAIVSHQEEVTQNRPAFVNLQVRRETSRVATVHTVGCEMPGIVSLAKEHILAHGSRPGWYSLAGTPCVHLP